MMAHDQHLAILTAWTPEQDDLPDETALHLDECEACRTLFDAKYAPLDLHRASAVQGDGDTLLQAALDQWAADAAVRPPGRRRWLRVAVASSGLLAACFVGVVLLSVTMIQSAPESGEDSPLYSMADGEPGVLADPVGGQTVEKGRYASYGVGDTDALADGGESTSTTIRIIRGSSERDALESLGYLSSNEDKRDGNGLVAEYHKVEHRNLDDLGIVDREKGEGGGQTDPTDNAEGDGAERFTDYGFRPFVPTALDPLSTFSIDVDTASYSFTRSKLRSGYLPPAAAVRVEEFVNYLPYEYDRPTGPHPFTVDVEASPSPFNPATHLVRVGIQGRVIAADQRKAVHLTFLVDTSGSMQSDDKLGLVKRSLDLLVDELEDGDTVALVTYAGDSRIVLEPTPIARRADIKRAIARLESGGSTAMGDGIISAYALADDTFAEAAVNRVIVCSDGDANVGPVGHFELSTLVGDYAGRGITLTTVGVGQGNYQDTTMERLANDGDGQYVYIDSLAEARRVFVDRLTGTLEVIARDVKIQVEFDPDRVEEYRLVGYENRHVADVDFTNDQVDAGEVGAGHQVTALYEVRLADGVRGELGTVRLRYKAPGPDAPSVGIEAPLRGTALRSSFAEGSSDFRMAVGMAAFAEVLRGSPYVEGVSLDQVEKVLLRAQRAEYREDAELVELIGIARSLRE